MGLKKTAGDAARVVNINAARSLPETAISELDGEFVCLFLKKMKKFCAGQEGQRKRSQENSKEKQKEKWNIKKKYEHSVDIMRFDIIAHIH